MLPDAPWRSRADLLALIAALGAGRARYVGGAVRDTLLGLPVSDIDLATDLRPEEVIARANAAGIRTVPTGIAHGTVTAVLTGGPVEITSLRRDVATDGRHASVEFGDDWRADAARRDFTINALYADPASGEIFDWFGGRDDLAAGRVRFIGAARDRIGEDHLRILRYFRFVARFGGGTVGGVADAAAEEACAALAPTLKGLSRERVAMELLKLLALPDPGPTVARMAELGVLGVILPEADAGALLALIAAETREGIAADPLRRLAALLRADPAMAEQVAARLRLSTAAKKRLTLAAFLPGTGRGTVEGGGGGGRPNVTSRPTVNPLPHPAATGAPARPASSDRLSPAGDLTRLRPPPPLGEDHAARALAYAIGREGAIDRLLLSGQSVAAVKDWPVPRFPLTGGAVVARGIAAGPEVARILKAVEVRWVAEGFPSAQRAGVLLGEQMALRRQ